MKNIIKILSVTGILLSSVTAYAKPATDLSGLWEETILDKDYENEEKDLFHISNFRDQTLINAVNYETFAIGPVKREGLKLKFTMLNFIDRSDIYILDYECREIVSGKELKCKFINQQDEVESEILWKKQNINREFKMQNTSE